MAKIARKVAKVFGLNAGLNEIAEFGSLAAGLPVFTTDPDVIQSLSVWLEGWFGAVIGANSPSIEDMNAMCYVFGYQLAYIMQTGVPEWNTDTVYYIGSVAQDSFGNLYTSLTDNNTGNALTDAANWAPPGGSIQLKTANYTALRSDGFIKCDTTAGSFTLTLADPAETIGQQIKVIQVGSDDNSLTIVSSSGNINGEASQEITGSMASIILVSDGTDYYVF